MTETTTDLPPPPSAAQLIPGLPDDVALQCLARVPRARHPTLSLVCKSWHSTMRSPALFNARSLLRTTECFLYLNLRHHSTFHWYTLTQNTPTNPHLIPLPSLPVDTASSSGCSPNSIGLSHLINGPKTQPIGPSFAVHGPKIYVIGGSHNEIPSNSVWVFDCRFNEWVPGPKMRVGREFSAAGVVEGKIYVMGGCVVDNWARAMNWAEVFDPMKGSWASVPSPIEVRDKWMHASAVIGGKVYAMADRGGVVYDVKKREWGSVSKRLDLGWRGRAAVVGGVLYCYDYLGKIRGYDVTEDRWKELRGVEKGLPKFLCGATMVNFNGRLCVVWEGKGSGKELDIMCAEIEVKKDKDGGLSGTILWSNVILVIPHGASIVQCLAVEL